MITAEFPTTAKMTTNHTELLNRVKPIMSSQGFKSFGSGVHCTCCNLNYDFKLIWQHCLYCSLLASLWCTYLKLVFPQINLIWWRLISVGTEWNVPMSSSVSSKITGGWWSILNTCPTKGVSVPGWGFFISCLLIEQFTKRSDPFNQLGNSLIHAPFPFFGRFLSDLVLVLFAQGAHVFLEIRVFGGRVLFRVLERTTVKVMGQFGFFQTLEIRNYCLESTVHFEVR